MKNAGLESLSNRVTQKNNDIPESFTVYIPKNLDIDRFLSENPPSFKFDKDKLVYIISLMYSIPARLKDFDFDKNNGFVPISSTILQRRIHDYKKYITYLIQYGVFETDDKYSNYGGKSYWFKLAEKYDNKIAVGVQITKYTLIKSIVLKSSPKEEDSYLSETPLDSIPYLTKWFNEYLSINMQGVDIYLAKLLEQEQKDSQLRGSAINKYNIRRMEAEKLSKHEYSLSIDRTSGRFHTPLTRLKSELRPYVTYEGKTLVSLDLKNSQPFLSLVFTDIDLYEKNNMKDILSIYNSRYKDILHNGVMVKSQHSTMLEELIRDSTHSLGVLKYKQWVSEGELYDYFALHAGKMGYDLPEGYDPRKEAKKSIFGLYFSPNSSLHTNDDLWLFLDFFYEISQIFRLIKQGRSNHNALACSMQYLEAQLVLHKACKIIAEKNPEIPLFTIHDSIVTTEEYADFVKEILSNVVKEAIGVEPMIKIEFWK